MLLHVDLWKKGVTCLGITFLRSISRELFIDAILFLKFPFYPDVTIFRYYVSTAEMSMYNLREARSSF